ncbi:hypothetical protein Tco_0099260 [Tanacetum coccineum]
MLLRSRCEMTQRANGLASACEKALSILEMVIDQETESLVRNTLRSDTCVVDGSLMKDSALDRHNSLESSGVVAVVGAVVRGSGGEQATVVVVVCYGGEQATVVAVPRQNTFGCDFFLWKKERVRLLVGSPGVSTTPIYSPGSSSTPIYSPGASTPQSYSLGSSRNAKCSNCKHLLGKITVLEATVEMYMHPKQHTINSAALLHKVYNDMGKLDLE